MLRSPGTAELWMEMAIPAAFNFCRCDLDPFPPFLPPSFRTFMGFVQLHSFRILSQNLMADFGGFGASPFVRNFVCPVACVLNVVYLFCEEGSPQPRGGGLAGQQAAIIVVRNHLLHYFTPSFHNEFAQPLWQARALLRDVIAAAC
ncbi:hypothetical protein Vretifemale_21049, partial [Volvox reticuliferus]